MKLQCKCATESRIKALNAWSCKFIVGIISEESLHQQAVQVQHPSADVGMGVDWDMSLRKSLRLSLLLFAGYNCMGM